MKIRMLVAASLLVASSLAFAQYPGVAIEINNVDGAINYIEFANQQCISTPTSKCTALLISRADIQPYCPATGICNLEIVVNDTLQGTFKVNVDTLLVQGYSPCNDQYSITYTPSSINVAELPGHIKTQS